MITKVFDAQGKVAHDCVESGCYVSWDGYVVDADRFNAAHLEDIDPGGDRQPLGAGDAVPGREDPGEEWDTSKEGEARPKGHS